MEADTGVFATAGGCYSQGYAGGYAQPVSYAPSYPRVGGTVRAVNELRTGLWVFRPIHELHAGLHLADPDDLHAGVRDGGSVDLLVRLRTLRDRNECRGDDRPRDPRGGCHDTGHGRPGDAKPGPRRHRRCQSGSTWAGFTGAGRSTHHSVDAGTANTQ